MSMLWSHVTNFINYFAITEFHPMLLSGLVIVIMLAHKYLQNIAVPGSWQYYVALAIGLVAQTSFLLVTVKYQAFLQQPADYIIDMILGDSPPQEFTPPSEEVKPLPPKAPKRLPAPIKDDGSFPAVLAVVFVAVVLFPNL
jgi:hypothetical protein